MVGHKNATHPTSNSIKKEIGIFTTPSVLQLSPPTWGRNLLYQTLLNNHIQKLGVIMAYLRHQAKNREY